MKLNYIYIAICTVKLVKVINFIWSWYHQFYTIITCTDTHNLLRGVLKCRYLKVHEGLKQTFTSYPICHFYIFLSLPVGPTAHLDSRMWSLHFLWLCSTPQSVRSFCPSILKTEPDSDKIRPPVVPLDLCCRDFQAAQGSLIPFFLSM